MGRNTVRRLTCIHRSILVTREMGFDNYCRAEHPVPARRFLAFVIFIRKKLPFPFWVCQISLLWSCAHMFCMFVLMITTTSTYCYRMPLHTSQRCKTQCIDSKCVRLMVFLYESAATIKISKHNHFELESSWIPFFLGARVKKKW